MKKSLSTGMLLGLVIGASLSVSASASDFSLNAPFDAAGPLPSEWVTSGSVAPLVVDTPGQVPSSVLQLTSNDFDQRGFVLYNQPIPVDRGLSISFTAAQWGGYGAADGISFFVKDATDTDTTPGSAGGGLGYAPDIFTDTPGLSGALLGVGLDGYGNFDEVREDGTDCGAGPTQYPWPDFANTVLVRGPSHGTTSTGYCRLTDTIRLSELGLPALVGSSNRADAAREITVTIDPVTAADPRVKVSYEGTQIVDIPLPAEFANVENIKFGFSASTGGETNYHEIWGLSVGVLNPSEPTTDVETPSLLASTGLDGAGMTAGAVLALFAGAAGIAVQRRASCRLARGHVREY